MEGGPKLLQSWPANGPKLLWTSGPLPGKHSGNGSPIVYDGRVYTYADLELPRAGTKPFTKELQGMVWEQSRIDKNDRNIPQRRQPRRIQREAIGIYTRIENENQ